MSPTSHKLAAMPPQQQMIGGRGSYSYALSQMLRLEQALLTLYEDAPFGLHTTDSEDALLSINTQALSWLGYRRNEVIAQKRFQDLLVHSSQSKYLKYIKASSEKYTERAIKLELRKKNGETLPCTLHSKNQFDSDGHITSRQSILFSDDVAGDLINENSAPAYLATSVIETSDGAIIADAERRILQVNQAYSTMSGYSADELLGKKVSFHRNDLQNKAFYEAMWAHASQNKQWQGELWSCRKNGEVFLAQCTINAITNQAQDITHYIATFIDISINTSISSKIRHLAFYDSLTDLPNRQLMTDRLNQALALTNRSGYFGALLFIDLDDFKMINDTLGHDKGDALLQQVAKRLTACLRSNDTVARFGGDEFVVILEHLSKEATDSANRVKNIGTKILTSLKQPYVLEKDTVIISASIGADVFGKSSPSALTLLRNADIAMYQAKKSGRDALCFFNEKMQSAINIHATELSELRQAISQKQFVLYYQLQVNQQADVIGCEALIRWQHPKRGLVTPNHFIPIAEESGLILPLGLWVLDSACAQLKQWSNHPLTANIPISINVSAKQLHQKDFVNQVKTAIKKHGIQASLLRLEITESMLIEDIENTILSMMTLKKLGVVFELDDFGTGYSSLLYLKRLPLKQLKIERSFVHSMCQYKSDQAIIKTIIAIAQNLNLDVIAEGVETEAEKALLIGMGCKHFQGYLFAVPLPIAELNKRLKQTKPKQTH